MDYQYFSTLLKNKCLINSKDIVVFSKLPSHHKEMLFSMACFQNDLINAQALEKRVPHKAGFIANILSTLLCEHPQENSQLVNWLFSFGEIPDLGKKYCAIIEKQNPEIWDIAFSYVPFNETKLYNLIMHSIKSDLFVALDWIVDKHKKSLLPYHQDMYYWGMYCSYQVGNQDLGQEFMNRILTMFPQDLNHIKEKMSNSIYSLPKFPGMNIRNDHYFLSYFNELENKALHFKLDKELKFNDIKTKRLKL